MAVKLSYALDYSLTMLGSQCTFAILIFVHMFTDATAMLLNKTGFFYPSLSLPLFSYGNVYSVLYMNTKKNSIYS